MTGPTITVMCAASLDGRLAPGAEASSRPYGDHIPEQFTEQLLRLREAVDAIVVGSKTVELDDSRLIPPSGKELLRVVVDSTGRLDREYTLLSDEYPTVVAVSEETPDAYRHTVESTDNKRTAALGDEKVDPRELAAFLDDAGVEHVLLEGGGRLIYEFLDCRLVDDVRILFLPYVVGEEAAPSVVDGPSSLFGEVTLDVERREHVGDFTLLCGDVSYDGPD